MGNLVKQSHSLFLMVGLISQSKGHFEAVKALALLAREGRDVRLLVAGSGAARELVELAKQEGVSDRLISWDSFLIPGQHISDLVSVSSALSARPTVG